MRTLLSIGLVSLSLAGCFPQAFDIWIEKPPEVVEPPIPDKFEAGAEPELIATEVPGLRAAPTLGPHVYYFEPDERWYRYAFNRWYEAFYWDGHWFPAAKVPEALEEEPLKP